MKKHKAYRIIEEAELNEHVEKKGGAYTIQLGEHPGGPEEESGLLYLFIGYGGSICFYRVDADGTERDVAWWYPEEEADD